MNGDALPSYGTVPAVHAWRTNGHLIADVARLGYLDGDTIVDATYGRGRFWTHYRPPGLVTHDLHTVDGVDFRALPYPHRSIDVLVLDPPYKLNGTPALGDFDNAYGIDQSTRWQDRVQLILDGITEASRVLRRGGRLLLKCQDQVVSGRVRWLTIDTTIHARHVGLTLVDRFDMTGTTRPQPAGRRQVHAHGRPSTLLVFEVTG